jgi:hypothetical protein
MPILLEAALMADPSQKRGKRKNDLKTLGRKPKPNEFRRPKPGSKAEAILTLTTTTPASPVEIAESVHCTRGAVSQTLKRYGIIPNRLESYKKHRADVYAGLQLKVIKHLNNEETLKAASTNNLAYTLTQLHTMERTERGQPSMLIGHGVALSPALQDAVDRIVQRLEGAPVKVVDNPVDNP